MKPKEREFAKKLLNLVKNPYEAGKAVEFSDDKQLVYYLEKWTEKGWWDYGVTLRSGWFTPEGIEHFEKLLTEDK